MAKTQGFYKVVRASAVINTNVASLVRASKRPRSACPIQADRDDDSKTVGLSIQNKQTATRASEKKTEYRNDNKRKLSGDAFLKQ
jgi:hypothetical protein